MRFHVNPETGAVGACRAMVQCRFGDLDDHYPTAHEARLAYEATQNTFNSPVVLESVHTPENSYLPNAGAREMWARGATVNMHDAPPYFELKKQLGFDRGFLAGQFHDSKTNTWLPASFTPDGNMAFVDANRYYATRGELRMWQWVEARQAWQAIAKHHAGDEADIRHALEEAGYVTNPSGMILARERRRLAKNLEQTGLRRPSLGTVHTGRVTTKTPPLLKPPLTQWEMKTIQDVQYEVGAMADDLEGSVPDVEEYRFAAENFLDEVENIDGVVTLDELRSQAKNWARADDVPESTIGHFVLGELRRRGF